MARLVCWRCGEHVRDMDRPIRRLTQCHACGADLHVCRLCRLYNPGILGRCDHDFAEPPLEKETANFCQYFKPRPDAYSPQDDQGRRAAQSRLEALFGEDEQGRAAGDANDPLDQLRALFGDGDGEGDERDR